MATEVCHERCLLLLDSVHVCSLSLVEADEADPIDYAAEWDEQLHPRDRGKFSAKSGAGTSTHFMAALPGRRRAC